MNGRITKVGLGLIVCFSLLFLQLTRIQVLQADELDENPENLRSIDRSYEQGRGIVASADGAVLARSVETPDSTFARRREFPEGELFAHVTGYYSFEYGAEGIERTFNDELAGLTEAQRYDRVSDLFVDRDRTADVTLTLRKDVQEAARAALGQRKGSVVVLDPRTGAIQALWSYPSYDPNLLSDHDTDAVRAAWQQLNDDPAAPMLARSYRERFAPGSTFKVVTAAVGVESGVVTATNPVFPQASSYTPPASNNPIGNFGGEVCGGTLVEVLTVSCNSAFAQLGAELIGPQRMVSSVGAFGFNTALPVDLPVPAVSVFPTDFGAEISPGVFEDSARLAQAAIGQNDVAATPLTMAMVAAAVANDGRAMRPHALDRIVARDGEVLTRVEPQLWQRPVSPETAALIREAMQSVVARGTATALGIDGVEVGAKTGTAEVGDGEATNAWVIGYAGTPGQVPSVAFAVIVEADPGIGEQTGGQIAAPIARSVVEVALGAQPRQAG
ncbi:MAG: peptidoglycan D,D-transpeptidase FtsI family protein [Acidimicrobiia bacterium]